MDKFKQGIIQKKIDTTIENLKKNNMGACFVNTKADLIDKLKELLNDGDKVTVGGSETLFESGVIDFLKTGNYEYLDRYEEGLSRDEINNIFIDAFSCDAYISSSNAITQNGEIYNVDGNANRVAAILFGPKKVIIIVGYNKIVKDLDEAISRVKTISAPSNASRLGCKTYCNGTGECVSLKDKNARMCDGCDSDTRICCSYTVCARQRKKDRINVIIVKEELGY